MNGKGESSRPSGSAVPSEQVNSNLQEKIPHNSEFDLQKIFVDERKIYAKILNYEENLRTDVYNLLANSTSLKKRCKDLLAEFTNYMEKKMFSIDCTSVDMLYLLAYGKGVDLSNQSQKVDPPKINCIKMSVPLFPELRLTKNNISKDNKNGKRTSLAPLESAEKIGVQHIVICSVPNTILSGNTSDMSSDSSELLDEEVEPVQKKIKTNVKEESREICQKAKQISVASHIDNYVRDPDVYCQVDILILIDTKLEGIGLKVSNHLGLIFADGLLGNLMTNSDSLLNPDSKIYKLLQTLIAEKLMFGFSNIVVTSSTALWKHICANVRGVISDAYFTVNTDNADFVLVLQKASQEHVTLSCIKGISEIINRSLGLNVSFSVNYELSNKKVCSVNFPIISLIPLYIVRYFTQLNKVQMFDDTSLNTLFVEESNMIYKEI